MRLNSRELKDFFVGCLLGDGNLHNGVFSVTQTSEDLIKFKHNIIKSHLPNVKVKITKYPARIDKNGVNHQEYYVLYTSPTEYFKKLQKEFYPYGKKIVPEKYSSRNLFNIGYAMWYADDGTTIHVKKHKETGSSISRRVQFCTDNFTEDDVKNKLLPMVSKLYGECSLVKRKPGVYRIQINKGSDKYSEKFIFTIYSFFYNYFPSLLYKMDLGYRGSMLFDRNIVSLEYHNLFTNMKAHSQFKDRLLN
jgi:hypothetical protein